MPKLAIIGASYLQVPLYLKAQELGIETIGFSWPEGAVAKDICTRFYAISTLEKEKILEVCEKEQVDGILTIATDIAVPTVNYVATKMRLVGNSIESGEISTNKFQMREVLSHNFVKCPTYFKISALEEMVAIQSKLTYPIIVKPVDRSGSKGVTKVENEDSLPKAISNALNESLSKSAIIESFIEGVEVSVESISYKGEHHILAITDKVTSGAPHFVELEHHQPSALPIHIQEEIRKNTIQALNALDIKNGASHSEFLISGEEIYVTEIGARMGGDFIGSDLVYLSTGFDFLKGAIDVALNRFETPHFKYQKHSGILFYTEQTTKVKELFEDEKTKPYIKQSEFNPLHQKEVAQSADRSGYFIYQANKKISCNNTI